MKLQTITREEFDQRIDAYNERRARELDKIEEQQVKVDQLLSQYEGALDRIEAELDQVEGAAASELLRASLRQRLTQLAEATVQVAASL